MDSVISAMKEHFLEFLNSKRIQEKNKLRAKFKIYQIEILVYFEFLFSHYIFIIIRFRSSFWYFKSRVLVSS